MSFNEWQTVKRILVIDDEEAIREFIIKLLEFEKFEVISAENGLIGLDKARRYHPDLIICDVMMPEFSGHEVLLELRKDSTTAGIPFIFLTAMADRGNVRQGMELGADDYLTKPIKRDELLKAINTRLAKQVAIRRQYEKKLDELRRNISSSLPHELRTPLNAIFGLSELIVENFDSINRDEALDMLKNINLSAGRLHKLLENFWFYAKLELLATDPENLKMLKSFRTNSTNVIIERIAKQKARTAGRDMDLCLELSDAIEIQISETNLEKLVAEVIDNAFKYSLSKTPVNVITTNNINSFSLIVKCKGRGMTPYQITNIGAYMQFDRQSYEQQGAGLGLAIAKRLTELHGGGLEIESIPNEDTYVQITLPKASMDQMQVANSLE